MRAPLKAAAILDAQFAKHPDHPGVAHYLIHAYDFPPIAQKGLPAALLLRRYRARRVACAAHALAYLHTRRAVEGIDRYQRAFGGCGEGGEQSWARRCTPWTTWSMRICNWRATPMRSPWSRIARGSSTPAVRSRSMRVLQYRRATRWNASNGAKPPRCPIQPQANFPIPRQ